MNANLGRANAGSLAGFAATIPMTALMTGLLGMLPREDEQMLEPRLITEQLLRRLGLGSKLSGAHKFALASLFHFGYGAATGAALMSLQGRSAESPIVRGAVYGVGVWAVGYLGWLPAMRILPPAHRRPPRRNFENIAAHLLWGATMASLAEQLQSHEKPW